MSSRRTASGRRSSCVNTTTWRSARRGLQHARQPVHARRVHRLHGVVDHDEAERALGQGRARDEQAERERVQLALAHHAQRRALHAVHRHVEHHPPPGAVARELDAPQLDVALLAQLLPDGRRLLRDGPEAIVADARRGLLEPRLRLLDALQVARLGARPPRAGQPARDLGGHRAPCVLLALDARARVLAQAVRRRRAAAARGFDVAGELSEVRDPRRPDPRAQRLDQLGQVEADLGRALQRVALQDGQLLPRRRAASARSCAASAALRGRRAAASRAVCCLRAQRVERALAAADGAVAVAVRRVERERPLQQPRRVARARRGGARWPRPGRRPPRASPPPAAATRAGSGGSSLAIAAQHVGRRPLPPPGAPGPQRPPRPRPRSHSLPSIAATTRRARSSSTAAAARAAGRAPRSRPCAPSRASCAPPAAPPGASTRSSSPRMEASAS